MARVVVITGASSGIGKALACAWAARGARLVLGGRNEVALSRAAREVASAGGQALVEAGDITQEECRVRLISRALREYGRLDVLVNNAGRGCYGAVRDIDVRELGSVFALNVAVPVRLAQLALEPLGRAGGTIVMLSSVAGVVAVPRMGAYAATKFALEALSTALRAEVAADGIRVLVVRPGPVDTPFRQRAYTSDGASGVRPRAARVQSAEQVAAMILCAVERGDAVLETSWFVRVASFASRIAPGAFRKVAERMAKQPAGSAKSG